MAKLTGRDLKDFTLTMRELAPLPWRRTATNANGMATQFRANGLVSGFLMTVTQDIDYYPDNHPNYAGLVEKMTYSLEGPDVDDNEDPTIKTIELTPLYDASGNMTGQDVKIDNVSVVYNP